MISTTAPNSLSRRHAAFSDLYVDFYHDVFSDTFIHFLLLA
jgi:hypothetical protein